MRNKKAKSLRAMAKSWNPKVKRKLVLRAPNDKTLVNVAGSERRLYRELKNAS